MSILCLGIGDGDEVDLAVKFFVERLKKRFSVEAAGAPFLDEVKELGARASSTDDGGFSVGIWKFEKWSDALVKFGDFGFHVRCDRMPRLRNVNSRY